MLDQDTRTAILKLRERGHGLRTIAAAVGVSRNAVRRVLEHGSAEVPGIERRSLLDEHVDAVRELYAACKGNLVRVAECLEERGVVVGYSTVTAFCRRHEIGRPPKQPAGHYHFRPGEEMQHDTSPHLVEVGGRKRRFQCASLVMCYSRKRYAQLYRRFTRFEARVFLSEAIPYIGGATERCEIDNSSVIIVSGTGPDAIPASEMAALADRFGFAFEAHELGDANRSARVERPFHHIENNFYAGRTFTDLIDLNQQLRAWCDRVNAKHRDDLAAKPDELHAVELPYLKPLPLYIPEVYMLHMRRVDVDGYVCLHTNRYSVPIAYIGRQLDVRETLQRVRIFDGPRLVADHARLPEGSKRRQTVMEHREGVRRRRTPPPPSREESQLREAAPELATLIDALRKRHGGRAIRAVRRLHRLWRDYPLEPLRAAVAQALRYDLVDLERIERMVLRNVAGDFFRLTGNDQEDEDG